MVLGWGGHRPAPEGRPCAWSAHEPLPNYYDWRFAMDITILGEFINQYGFPIVCCGVLFYLNYKQQQRHKEESDKWTEALNNNTKVMERLVERLER